MPDHAAYQRLLKYEIPEVVQALTQRDTMLYALGVGLGADPMDEQQLRFVYEKNLVALPTMAVVLAAPSAWLRKTDTGFGTKSVHGEQSFVIHKPLPVEGTLVGVSQLASVADKGIENGKNRGAVIVTERKVYDKQSGDLLATLSSSSFCRDDGGFGGPNPPSPPPHAIPQGAPQFSCDLPTLPQAALIYRLSGDYNILHSDPQHAQKVGFPRPILHGLCTFGVAGHAMLKTLCGYDATRFKSMQARFSSPVYPGETLRTEMWKTGNVVSFRCTVPARDNVVVLNNGRAEMA